MRKIGLLAIFLSLALVFGTAGIAEANEVEIFSWWTAGGEEDALLELIDVFEENYPEYEVINSAVAGGAGAQAKAVMITRMVGGNPPDSFQVHGGAELMYTYVEPELMRPLNDLLEEWGYMDNFNEEILEMSTHDGNIYSIPLNVHRSNVLWYNVDMLEEHGLEAPESFDEMFEVFDALQNEGVTPLALGDMNRWPALHLFETYLAATLGPENYNALWEGEVGFDHPGVTEALELLDRTIDYVNTDHASLDWQGAAELLVEEQAVFTVMGDWAEGYFRSVDWEPNEDYGWTTVPGTEGNFMVITDTFGLPIGAPNPEGAEAWLETVASVEGQDAFNPVKGSIPARLDADRDQYNVYLQSSMDDFSEDALTPSIAHGSAAPEALMSSFEDVINEFITDRDIETTQEQLDQAASEYF